MCGAGSGDAVSEGRAEGEDDAEGVGDASAEGVGAGLSEDPLGFGAGPLVGSAVAEGSAVAAGAGLGAGDGSGVGCAATPLLRVKMLVPAVSPVSIGESCR